MTWRKLVGMACVSLVFVMGCGGTGTPNPQTISEGTEQANNATPDGPGSGPDSANATPGGAPSSSDATGGPNATPGAPPN